MSRWHVLSPAQYTIAGTAGGRSEQNWWGKRLVELDAETGVDQWLVPTADLRHLGLEDLILSV